MTYHRTNRVWYVVVNFNETSQVEGVQHTRACLRLGLGKSNLLLAKAIDCKIVGNVRIHNGEARFNGGYVLCDPINIGAAQEEIGIPLIGRVDNLPTFYIAVKGRLSPGVAKGAPLFRYELATPSTDRASSIRINVAPSSKSQPEGFVDKTSLNERLQGPGLTIAIRPALDFTGLFEVEPSQADPSTSDYIWRRWSKKTTLEFETEVPVSISYTQVPIGESKLYIGGLPTGERFDGNIDLLILDPDGGDRGGGI